MSLFEGQEYDEFIERALDALEFEFEKDRNEHYDEHCEEHYVKNNDEHYQKDYDKDYEQEISKFEFKKDDKYNEFINCALDALEIEFENHNIGIKTRFFYL